MNKYVNDFNETVKQYYKDLKKYSPMSKDEERKLLIKAKNNDLNAQNKILEANLRFVFEVAKRYKGNGVPLEDLISEGNMGLIKAIQKFDLSRDVKFYSYAVWWIKQSIIAFLKENYNKNIIEKSEETLFNNSIDNSKMSDCEDDRVHYMESIMSNESDLNDLEKNNEISFIITKTLNDFDERSKEMIIKYYGLDGDEPMTLSEVGEIYGISKERVRQICKKSLETLKNKLEYVVK